MSTAATGRLSAARPKKLTLKSSTTIHIRASQETKQLIDDAASAVGKTLSEFVLDSARREATDVLLDQRLYTLDAAKYDAFVTALDNPPPAGKALKTLMKHQPPWAK